MGVFGNSAGKVWHPAIGQTPSEHDKSVFDDTSKGVLPVFAAPTLSAGGHSPAWQRISGLLLSLGAALLASALLATPSEAKDAAELDLGGRSLRFADSQVAHTLRLPFGRDSALVQVEALEAMRNAALGTITGANGTLLHVVTVAGDDPTLAFKRARALRAALARLGSADPRALAAAADGFEPPAAIAEPPAGAPTEWVPVRFVRLSRAECAGCTQQTLAAAALDTAVVSLATLRPASAPAGAQTTGPGKPGRQEAAKSAPARELAKSSDHRKTGTGQPTARSAPSGASMPVANIRRSPTRPPETHAARTRSQHSAAASHGPQLFPPSSPDCRVRVIVIDDYTPAQRVWICPRS
jgi:hypothetical protein